MYECLVKSFTMQPVNAIEEEINRLGKDGWKLVAIDANCRYVFIKEVLKGGKKQPKKE